MKGQKKIKSFFKPVNKTVLDKEEAAPVLKKFKAVNDPNTTKNLTILDESDESNKSKLDILSMCKKYTILDPTMGSSWSKALAGEFNQSYFQKLDQYMRNEIECFKVYPSPNEVWSWTKMCPLQDVKVVILGQDPYHNPGQAHGLCFSVKSGVRPPPSLLNIYKELASDIPGFHPPTHGDLTKWATQGVLLLNACLTVRENAPNSHAGKGWEQVTDAAIKAVNCANKNVVFLLWGAYAQKKAIFVDKGKHFILKAPHPSPLSASRGFFGCKHFSKCNELLEEAGKLPIDWKL